MPSPYWRVIVGDECRTWMFAPPATEERVLAIVPGSIAAAPMTDDEWKGEVLS